jgi:hypothetical protein
MLLHIRPLARHFSPYARITERQELITQYPKYTINIHNFSSQPPANSCRKILKIKTYERDHQNCQKK